MWPIKHTSRRTWLLSVILGTGMLLVRLVSVSTQVRAAHFLLAALAFATTSISGGDARADVL